MDQESLRRLIRRRIEDYLIRQNPCASMPRATLNLERLLKRNAVASSWRAAMCRCWQIAALDATQAQPGLRGDRQWSSPTPQGPTSPTQAGPKADPVSLDTVWTTMTAAKEARHEGKGAKANHDSWQ